MYCLDMEDLYLAGRKDLGGVEFRVTVELCIDGPEKGCAPKEDVIAWAQDKLFYVPYQDLYIDNEDFETPLKGQIAIAES